MNATYYHGSKNLFNRFNFDNMRTNGTAMGVGLYFTTDKKEAQGYGDHLYSVSLNLIKPMNTDTVTVTRPQLVEIIKLMELDEVTEIVSNFGDESREPKSQIIERASGELIENNSNDVELLAELYNLTGGEGKTLDIFSAVTGMTHVDRDGVVVVVDLSAVEIVGVVSL